MLRSSVLPEFGGLRYHPIIAWGVSVPAQVEEQAQADSKHHRDFEAIREVDQSNWAFGSASYQSQYCSLYGFWCDYIVSHFV